jgi:kynureninase
MAVGCGYKYLNGGPGAPAFIYAAKRHIADIQQPLSGWWGHANPFAFDAAYQADAGIRKFLCGTQPILSLRAMKAGLEMYQAIDMQAIRAKSMALTEFFIELVEQSCAEYGVAVLSPRKASERGGQVALMFEHSYAAMQAIIARGVIGDFRRPNIMRFGFSPLYISYQQVYEAVAILHQVLAEALWKAEKYHVENAVT